MSNWTKRVMSYLKAEHDTAMSSGKTERAKAMKYAWWLVFAATHGFRINKQ